MSETTSTTEAATTEAAATATPATQAPSQAEKTPEWYEAQLTKVRNEAASHRVAKNEAVEAAKAEVQKIWEDKLQAAQHENAQLALQYQKLEAALPKDVADTVKEFAALLQGDSPETLAQHADKLYGLFGGAPGTAKPVPAVDKTPAGSKPLALNDHDGLTQALMGALGIVE